MLAQVGREYEALGRDSEAIASYRGTIAAAPRGHHLRVDDLRRLYAKMLEVTDYAKVIEDDGLLTLLRDVDRPAGEPGFDTLALPLQNSHDETTTRHTRW